MFWQMGTVESCGTALERERPRAFFLEIGLWRGGGLGEKTPRKQGRQTWIENRIGQFVVDTYGSEG